MPAPVQVSPEQVAQAAASLAAQGKPINGWSLRAVIGKGKPERLLAGNYSPASRLLKRFA